MPEARISVPGLLCVWLLASHRMRSDATPHATHTRGALYDCYHAWMARTPDHVFEHAWQMLSFPSATGLACMQALKHLQHEFLVQRHQRWYVKPTALSAWQQGLLSRMSALPLLAFVGAKHHPLSTHSDIVQDYLQREGLHETHVHLNGSSYAETAWLHALQQPLQSNIDFSKNWKKSNFIKDLTRIIDPSLNPKELVHRLKTARRLRQHLIRAAHSDHWWESTTEIDPKEEFVFDDRETFTLKQELNWQTLFLEKCRQYPKNQLLPDVYHQYIILLNQYYQLTVQNEDRVGFDQFQKHADIGLRENLETNYAQRFKDAHGLNPRRSRVQYYEGRFAPKRNSIELRKRLLEIFQGYHQYLCDLLPQDHARPRKKGGSQFGNVLNELEQLTEELNNLAIAPLQLALVCHFIKKPWKKEDKNYAPYRHLSLVKDLYAEAHALLRLLMLYPKLKRWVRGVDGAANELHASPEYFAPIFRLCHSQGLTHKTFHAGEDFSHLLSGLRYMLEALELLNLQAGDRIGHGTAMGIDPSLWLSRMPQSIVISQGDWFLSVLAAWRLLNLNPVGLEDVTHKLTAELGRLSIELFGKFHHPYLCEQAFGLRHLSLPEVQCWLDNGRQLPVVLPLNDQLRQEMQLVNDCARANEEAFNLYWRWQSDQKVWSKSLFLIEVASDFLSAAHYILLQQTLMRKVAKREVVIETLPSSNVRISQYKHFSEHHAMRWMKAPQATKANDPDILVSLGSDDPGIFSTDIETEFHHLFYALKGIGLNETEALQRVSQLNERGRIYRFHPKLGNAI
jgi:adenosine deaminase